MKLVMTTSIHIDKFDFFFKLLQFNDIAIYGCLRNKGLNRVKTLFNK